MTIEEINKLLMAVKKAEKNGKAKYKLGGYTYTITCDWGK